jgi:hypothetical protein
MNTVQNGKGSAERQRIDFKKRRENHDAIKWPSQRKSAGIDLGKGRSRTVYHTIKVARGAQSVSTSILKTGNPT